MARRDCVGRGGSTPTEELIHQALTVAEEEEVGRWCRTPEGEDHPCALGRTATLYPFERCSDDQDRGTLSRSERDRTAPSPGGCAERPICGDDPVMWGPLSRVGRGESRSGLVPGVGGMKEGESRVERPGTLDGQVSDPLGGPSVAEGCTERVPRGPEDRTLGGGWKAAEVGQGSRRQDERRVVSPAQGTKALVTGGAALQEGPLESTRWGAVPRRPREELG